MPIDWNPTGDFSSILDASEAITLHRRGGAGTVEIASAWRFVDRLSEAEPTGGFAQRRDVAWQFEWPAGIVLPQLGERLIDAVGNSYTILAIECLQGGTRLRCESRNLRIAYGLDCLVDIEQAVWDGDMITDWTTYRPAVHARIQPSEMTVDETATPITSTALYRVTLEDPKLALDHNYRIVAADGAVYRVASFSGARRIDSLPVAVVRRE